MVLVRILGAPEAGVRERTAAAAPSVNDEHISRVSGGTMGGEASTSSMVISDWNWALGLRAPWWRDFTAAAANCSGVASRSSICFTHHEALRAMRTDPEGFSRSEEHTSELQSLR